VITVAEELGVAPGEVAIAWVAAKGSLPIIGPRTVAQLESNLASAKVRLAPEQIARLDKVSSLPPVFPYTMIHEAGTQQRGAGGKFDLLDHPAVPVA
jgi:diketogulonate reductase-like aldo/keto reductase